MSGGQLFLGPNVWRTNYAGDMFSYDTDFMFARSAGTLGDQNIHIYIPTGGTLSSAGRLASLANNLKQFGSYCRCWTCNYVHIAVLQ